LMMNPNASPKKITYCRPSLPSRTFAGSTASTWRTKVIGGFESSRRIISQRPTPPVRPSGKDRGRCHIGEALAVEKAQQQILLGDRERQRRPWPRPRHTPRRGHAMPGVIAVHEPAVQRERLTGTPQADVRGKLGHSEHHASPFVSSAVGSPSATHSFFWASMISSARSSLRCRRALSRCSCWICRAEGSGFGPRLFGASAA
jgi:hypothetical protein